MDRKEELENALDLFGFDGEVIQHDNGKYQFVGGRSGYDICTTHFPTVEEVALDCIDTLIDEARISERYSFVNQQKKENG